MKLIKCLLLLEILLSGCALMGSEHLSLNMASTCGIQLDEDECNVDSGCRWEIRSESCVSATAIPLPSLKVEANDTAYLWLIDEVHSQNLIGLSNSTRNGFLMPRELYNQIPHLAPFLSKDEIYNQLKVVAIRLDPCFPIIDLNDTSNCTNQIRLVMQPVSKGSAEDVALHIVYNISRKQLKVLLESLLIIKKYFGINTDDRALGVHPAYDDLTIGRLFQKEIQNKILDVIDLDVLMGVSYMKINMFRNAWIFGSLAYVGGELVPQTLSHTSTPEIVFSANDSGTEANFVSPIPAVTTDLYSLFDFSAIIEDKEKLQSGLSGAFVVEDPTISSITNTDCVSCHVSTTFKNKALQALDQNADTSSQFIGNNIIMPEIDFQTGGDDFNTDDTHNFGYFGKKVSISMRTVNEVARVTSYINNNMK